MSSERIDRLHIKRRTPKPEKEDDFKHAKFQQ